MGFYEKIVTNPDHASRTELKETGRRHESLTSETDVIVKTITVDPKNTPAKVFWTRGGGPH